MRVVCKSSLCYPNRVRVVRNCNHSRSGMAILTVLICILLTSMVGVSMVKSALVCREQAIQEELRLQAGWLAESAIDRAAAQLQNDADYTGETWNITAEEFGGRQGATVKINVATPSADGTHSITTTADFPADSPRRARVTRTASFKP